MTKGQQGPRGKKLYGDNYPLAQRETELRSEINSPTIPTIYNRIMTIDPTLKDVGGGEPGKKVNQTDLPDTWDSVAPMSEDNMRMKFVKMETESDDESAEYIAKR